MAPRKPADGRKGAPRRGGAKKKSPGKPKVAKKDGRVHFSKTVGDLRPCMGKTCGLPGAPHFPTRAAGEAWLSRVLAENHGEEILEGWTEEKRPQAPILTPQQEAGRRRTAENAARKASETQEEREARERRQAASALPRARVRQGGVKGARKGMAPATVNGVVVTPRAVLQEAGAAVTSGVPMSLPVKSTPQRTAKQTPPGEVTLVLGKGDGSSERLLGVPRGRLRGELPALLGRPVVVTKVLSGETKKTPGLYILGVVTPEGELLGWVPSKKMSSLALQV